MPEGLDKRNVANTMTTEEFRQQLTNENEICDFFQKLHSLVDEAKLKSSSNYLAPELSHLNRILENAAIKCQLI